MWINLVLLILAFGAQRKIKNPYIPALVLGLVKFGLYFVLTHQLSVALGSAAIVTVILLAFVFFLGRLDRKGREEMGDIPDYDNRNPTPKSFKWEYIPLSLLLVLLLFAT
jgi:Ca2+/Na+ antiporter